MIQVWTINILVIRSSGRTEKSQNGQKHHRKKEPNYKNQRGQNPQKRQYFNTPIIQGVRSHFCSCDHIIQLWTINILIMRWRGWREKSQNGHKHHRTKAPKDKNQSRQNPQKRKYFNTPTIKVYDNLITWYRVWTINILFMQSRGWTEKSKNEQMHHRTKSQRTKKSEQIPQKRKYFNTPTIKVYDNMITWYRCLESTFSSCDHQGGQRKVKMDKSTIGQKAPKDENQSG